MLKRGGDPGNENSQKTKKDKLRCRVLKQVGTYGLYCKDEEKGG